MKWGDPSEQPYRLGLKFKWDNLLTQSFTHLLSTYCVPGTIPGEGIQH